MLNLYAMAIITDEQISLYISYLRAGKIYMKKIGKTGNNQSYKKKRFN